jgi:hypothetical protein
MAEYNQSVGTRPQVAAEAADVVLQQGQRIVYVAYAVYLLGLVIDFALRVALGVERGE